MDQALRHDEMRRWCWRMRVLYAAMPSSSTTSIAFNSTSLICQLIYHFSLISRVVPSLLGLTRSDVLAIAHLHSSSAAAIRAAL
jgi:hypothetical protein